MFYKPQSDVLPVRHRCRNARCGAKLKVPVANRRAAFCCRGCARQFYAAHCLVCEVQFTRKTERRQVCWRSKCRYEFLHHSGSYFSDAYPIAGPGTARGPEGGPRPSGTGTAHNGLADPIKIGVKTDAKAGRGWRIVAGPADDLHPINLHDFPANAAAMRTGRPSSTLIKRDSFPVNIVGGHKFPGAPTIDLFEVSATSSDPEDAP